MRPAICITCGRPSGQEAFYTRGRIDEHVRCRARNEGAADAFGLMGMAEAIRGRAVEDECNLRMSYYGTCSRGTRWCSAMHAHVLKTDNATAKPRGSLSNEEIVQACKNIGYDMSCGACASVFYTSYGPYEHTCVTKETK